MSTSDKEAILIRVSEFLQKSVSDLADSLKEITKQVSEFQESLQKIRGDLKGAKVTPMATSSVPLLADTGGGLPPSELFDFLESGDTAALVTPEPTGAAEAILLGEDVPTTAPPAAPPPTAAPPTAVPPTPAPPKAAPPKAAPPAAAPPKAAPPAAAPPKAAPPAAAPTVPTPAAPPPTAAAPRPSEGIAGLRSEMMAEIKRIKEIFES